MRCSSASRTTPAAPERRARRSRPVATKVHVAAAVTSIGLRAGPTPTIPAKSSRTSSRTNRATRGSTIPASMSSIAARSSSEGWTNRCDGHVDIVKALLVTCGHNDTPVRSTASRTTERSPSTGTRSTGRARISVRARSRPASSTSPIDGGIVGTMSTSLSGPSPPRHALEDHEVCCAVSSRRATGGGRAPACGHRSGGVGRDALGQSPRAAGPVIARC